MSTKKLQILGSFGNGISDAKTLDGKPASYFATQSDIDELQLKVDEIDVSGQIESAIKNSKDAMILYVDEKFAAVPEFDPTEIQNTIDANAAAIDTKVDKVEGKGLSTNDYTTAEKDKLAAVEANANYYEHPAHSSHSSGLYKVTVDGEGHVSGVTLAEKEDIVALGIPAQDTTYDTEISDLSDRIDGVETEIQTTNDTLNSVSVELEKYKTDNNKAVSTNASAIETNKTAIAEIKEDYLTSANQVQLKDSIDELSEKITENTSAIEVLNGDGAGSVKQSIDNAFNKFAANMSNDNVVNTYKELIDYAAVHGPEFTELVGKVDTISTHVDEVEADLSNYRNTVSDQFDDINTTIGDHVNNIQESLDGKSDLEHEHDDLYYDKDEIDERFAEVDTNTQEALNGKADSEHVHDEYAKTTDVESMISEVSDSMEDVLETKAEMNHIHSEYAEIDHTHNEMNDVVYVSEMDTESATVPLNADTLGGYTVDTLKALFLNSIYPVGSIYMSVNSTNPKNLFGGTWTQITGRFLLAAGSNTANTNTTYGSLDAGSINRSAGEQGGEVKHTLTVNEMPSHSHKPSNCDTAGSDSNYKRHFTTNLDTGSESVGRAQIATGTSGRYVISATTSADLAGVASTTNTGGGAAHNNMPPYLVVYMWKRTV